MLEVIQKAPLDGAPGLPASLRAEVGLALGSLEDPADRQRLFDSRLHPGGLPELVSVPAGQLRMGTSRQDEERLKEQEVDVWEDEKPDHPVEISYDYRIGKYPVTNAEFKAFYDAGGYYLERCGDCWSPEGKQWRTGEWEPDLTVYSESVRERVREWLAGRPVEERTRPFFWDDLRFNTANQPVVGVSWFEAEAYCRWLTGILRRQGTITLEWGMRLPTEAEWERSARYLPADVSAGDRRLFPWGDSWDASRCNNAEPEDKLERTSPVGIYSGGASWLGVMDLAGNAWEWCLDTYRDDIYASRAQTGQTALNPLHQEGTGARVVRGGSWDNNRYDARCGYRSRSVPDDFLDTLGFRVVLVPSQFLNF